MWCFGSADWKLSKASYKWIIKKPTTAKSSLVLRVFALSTSIQSCCVELILTTRAKSVSLSISRKKSSMRRSSPTREFSDWLRLLTFQSLCWMIKGVCWPSLLSMTLLKEWKDSTMICTLIVGRSGLKRPARWTSSTHKTPSGWFTSWWLQVCYLTKWTPCLVAYSKQSTRVFLM